MSGYARATPMRNRRALALGASIVLCAARAHALGDHPIFVVPGYIHSFVGGHSPAAGNGVELSTVVGTETSGTRAGAAVGALAQLESLSGDHGRSTRWALAGQASVLGMGVEGGYARRTADDKYVTTDGVHLAVFLSLGYVSLAYRWTAALGHPPGTHGDYHGFVLALKLPFAVKGSFQDLIEIPYIGRGPITFGN